MSKNKNGKVIQMLSPENYIRKKARTIPIHQCLVNSGWKEKGIANVAIARRHTNGNITACFYLIDLYCLGVKNTQYLFNIPVTEFQKRVEEMSHINLKSISYELAHNIVYAGLEYAEEYGFKPHTDFTSITRFMLEEDTENIELIEIECGKDGKPFFVSGPYDDDLKIKKVIAQLKLSAGEGNYDFILGQPDEDEFDQEDEEIDELEGLSPEEKRNLFLQLKSMAETFEDEDADRLLYVTKSLFNELVDSTLADQYFDEYMDDMDVSVITGEAPDEMMGITPGSVKISDESRELFMKIFIDAVDNAKLARKLLVRIKKITPDVPAIYFLELQILKEEDSPLFHEKLQEYAAKYPDYSLIKLHWLSDLFSSETMPKEYLDQTFSLQSIFPERDELHNIELFHFLMFKLTELLRKGDAARLEGFCLAYEELGLSEDEIAILDELATIVKTHFIEIYLTQQNYGTGN